MLGWRILYLVNHLLNLDVLFCSKKLSTAIYMNMFNTVSKLRKIAARGRTEATVMFVTGFHAVVLADGHKWSSEHSGCQPKEVKQDQKVMFRIHKEKINYS